MIRKSLSRNDMKQITGGSQLSCDACTSSCLYEVDGPGAGCPPGGNCVLVECPSMQPFCEYYYEFRYRAVCDWEVV